MKNLILSLLVFSSIYGEIAEIQTIESLKPYVQDNTVVFLNVGDTLFAPSSMLADYKWRQYFVERANLVLGESKAAPVIDLVKGIIVEKIPKITPEKGTAAFIESLQKDQIPVLGYTERFFSTSYAPNNGKITSQQLINIGIDLEKTLKFFPAKDYQNEKYAFQYGMLFSNKTPMGPAIVDFFQTEGLKPARVILVDDATEALESSGKALAPLNIDFVGLRYAKSDEWKKSFDTTLGTIEFFSYMTENKLMSDEEAQQVKEKNPNVNWEERLDVWILDSAKKT